MEKEPVIRLVNVKKTYRRGTFGAKTLGEELNRGFARLFRKNKGVVKKTGKKGDEFFDAVKNVNLEIYKGEKVGLIGLNGAGKTTLLKLIARITSPTEGDIYIDGKISSILQIGTGFHPDLTGRENIYLSGTILGMTKKSIDERVEQIIDFSECREFIDTPIKRYSSGMLVKLAFSVTAFLRNDILIMDEVLAVGDINFQKKCLSKLNEVAGEEEKTILFVSHNMNSIRELCSRTIVLSGGEAVFDGDVESAIEYYISSGSADEKSAFDLADIKRTKGCRAAYSMQKAVLTEKDGSGFTVELYNEPTDSAAVRLYYTFFSSDHIPVATFGGEKITELRRGEQKAVVRRIDTRPLHSGVYSVTVTEIADVEGKQVLFDRVNDAFSVNVVKKDGEFNPGTFGFVNL